MWAILIKELIQMKRDRLTFAMILVIPIMQLVLFGYAINNDPKQMPTALQVEDNSPQVRAILAGLHHSGYFAFIDTQQDPRNAERLLASGEVSFVLSIPAGFTTRLIRGEHPQILLQADATDPVTTANAIHQIRQIVDQSLRDQFTGPLASLAQPAAAVDVVSLALFNPEGITQFNIVPGLVGVILTMTMVMITSMAMTREVERGNMENLLAMPIQPYEVIIGKITPYILVGAIQTITILLGAHWIFAVPFVGAPLLLIFGVGLFILTNLTLGFAFSTLARTQMQAMQMTFFFFLPSILLSGFMFPFHGMPSWAQMLGEALPLTHFLRVIRGVMLKDATAVDLLPDFLAMAAFMLIVGWIALKRYRQTLD